MKIILNIETNDPADLSRIAAALNGEAVTVTTTKPATTRASGKSETAASAATGPSSGQASTPAATSQPSDNGPSATTAASPPEQAAPVPSEADLIAAGNAAVAKVGVGGPDKVKKYIAEHFQKADGSPGTLKLTAEHRRAKLLADLQAIGRGEITL